MCSRFAFKTPAASVEVCCLWSCHCPAHPAWNWTFALYFHRWEIYQPSCLRKTLMTGNLQVSCMDDSFVLHSHPPPDTTIRHGHRWHGCWCFEATDDASRMMIHIKILLLGSVFSKLTWRVWYSRGCGLHAGVLVSLLLRNLAVAMLKLSWTPANFQPTWP